MRHINTAGPKTLVQFSLVKNKFKVKDLQFQLTLSSLVLLRKQS